MEYKTGLLHLADTLSRAYLPHNQVKCSKEDVHLLAVDVRSPVEQEVESVNTSSLVSISSQGLARVHRAVEADSDMGLLKTVIQTGCPGTKDEVLVSTQCYFQFSSEG